MVSQFDGRKSFGFMTIPNDCHSLGLRDTSVSEVLLGGGGGPHQTNSNPTNSNQELISVIGLMIGIIVASIGVGFYSMRKKF
jgi:hypothetical protein